MPPIRSSASAHRAKLVAVILLFSEIMPSCSHYEEKKLVYVIIIAPSSCQPSFYFKYTKSNMCLSCDIKSVSDAKYIFKFPYNIYSLSQLLNRNTWWYAVLLAQCYTY